jgi:homopolymeric O-antigen transport system permease protein
VPTAAVLAGLVDVAIAFVVLVGMLLVYGIVPTAAIVTLPLFVIFAAVTALAVALWLSALNVRYRDVRYTLPFIVQIWLFASPVVYPSSLVPEPWRLLYGLNPMAGVIDGFRWALLGGDAPGPGLLVSVAAVALLFTGGLLYFRKMERSFADAV